MKRATEIKRLQALIKIQKQFVHEPRDGRPVPRGVAKLWQVQLKSSQRYLRVLMVKTNGGKADLAHSTAADDSLVNVAGNADGSVARPLAPWIRDLISDDARLVLK